MRTRRILIITALLALAMPVPTAQAGGVVTVCDEAHLLAALVGGGIVTFSATCAANPVSNLDQRGVARPQGSHCDIGALEELRLWLPLLLADN
jgi:hypothetical protein